MQHYDLTFQVQVHDPEKLRVHLGELREEHEGETFGDSEETTLEDLLASVPDLDLGEFIAPLDVGFEVTGKVVRRVG